MQYGFIKLFLFFISLHSTSIIYEPLEGRYEIKSKGLRLGYDQIHVVRTIIKACKLQIPEGKYIVTKEVSGLDILMFLLGDECIREKIANNKMAALNYIDLYGNPVPYFKTDVVRAEEIYVANYDKSFVPKDNQKVVRWCNFKNVLQTILDIDVFIPNVYSVPVVSVYLNRNKHVNHGFSFSDGNLYPIQTMILWEDKKIYKGAQQNYPSIVLINVTEEERSAYRAAILDAVRQNKDFDWSNAVIYAYKDPNCDGLSALGSLYLAVLAAIREEQVVKRLVPSFSFHLNGKPCSASDLSTKAIICKERGYDLIPLADWPMIFNNVSIETLRRFLSRINEPKGVLFEQMEEIFFAEGAKMSNQDVLEIYSNYKQMTRNRYQELHTASLQRILRNYIMFTATLFFRHKYPSLPFINAGCMVNIFTERPIHEKQEALVAIYYGSCSALCYGLVHRWFKFTAKYAKR